MPPFTKEELLKRLSKYEWNDVEFKSYQNGVSKEVYKSVSAFSNSAGGHLVFGIEDDKGKLSIIGVTQVDKVQGEFLSCLKSGNKLGKPIEVQEAIIEHDDKTILVFYIPEAPHKLKPIYLNGDITQSYKRSGSGDHKCSAKEIESFLRDATESSFDNQPITYCNASDFYDTTSLKAYRRFYENRNQGKYAELSDLDFLGELGFILEIDGKQVPNRAGLLIFGKSRYILREVPRGILDFQKINAHSEDWTHEQRWHDRLFLEDNLFNTWRALMEKYINISEIPFALDNITQMRIDEPIDYTAFREAAVNLLIHQDYGDYSRTPVIKIFRDKTFFWNPGDAFATVEKLLDGVDSELRNPTIVRAFRQIGLSEQAGSGIRTIMRKCRELGYVPAQIKNDKSERSFSLEIIKQDLFSPQQVRFQTQLGAKLSENEALIFALICQKPFITFTEVKAALLKSNADSQKVIDQLLLQKLIEPEAEMHSWKLAEHLKELYQNESSKNLQMELEQVSEQVSGQAHKTVDMPPIQDAVNIRDSDGSGQVSGQVSGETSELDDNLDSIYIDNERDKADSGQVSEQEPKMRDMLHTEYTANKIDRSNSGQVSGQVNEQLQQVLDTLSNIQAHIILNTLEPISMKELKQKLDLGSKFYLRTQNIHPLLESGILLMSFPDTPRHRNQKYYLSEYGIELYHKLQDVLN